MSLAPPAPTLSSSSQPLPKFCSSFTPKLFPSNAHFHLTFSSSSSSTPHPRSLRSSAFIVRASDIESKSDTGLGDADQPYEEYQVELEQPYGLKFAKGRDGGTYIDAIAPGGSADKTGLFTVGDKVIATRYSLSFSLFFSSFLSFLFIPTYAPSNLLTIIKSSTIDLSIYSHAYQIKL